MNTEKLNALKDRAYKTAVEHRFHEDIKPDVFYLGLVMSEAGETINADQKGLHADTKAYLNCHVVMQMVKDKINKFAKEHNINYQV